MFDSEGGGGGRRFFYLHIGDRIMGVVGRENWRKARQTRSRGVPQNNLNLEAVKF